MQIRELYSHYRKNYPDRTALIAAVSQGINGLLGLGKLGLGLLLSSGWFVANAVYYLILFAAKFQILRRYAQVRKTDDPEARLQLERSTYRRSGGFLLLLGLSYLNVCLCMFLTGEATAYQGYIVYLVALVAFIKLGLAIWGNVAARKLHSPILSSLKILNLTDSTVSIVVTQYTLLSMKQPSLALQSSSLFGMACSILCMFAGLFMLRKRRA